MTDIPFINCPACGAPNLPEAGKIYIGCNYCGTNITIPEKLRTKAIPKMEGTVSRAKPISVPENEAAKLLRKAQPVAIGAWNLYALWTWVRWILPTCLVILLVGTVLCVILGALPVILKLIR